MPDPVWRKRLIVMVKEPKPGRVKTRLGRDIGMTTSAWWFRHQVQALLWRISDPRWKTILAVSPDHAGMRSRVWPQHLARFAQGGGNLGDRMARVMRSMPPGPVCIIGADIPGVTRHLIHDAFQCLGDHDAVFGPAPDGGYWLVGLKRTCPVPSRLFENVRWSTEYALADSMETLSKYRIGQIATLQDVDTLTDLQSLCVSS